MRQVLSPVGLPPPREAMCLLVSPRPRLRRPRSPPVQEMVCQVAKKWRFRVHHRIISSKIGVMESHGFDLNRNLQ